MGKTNSNKANLPTEKILHFNNKEISLVLANGQWWVAVKPICDVFNIEYTRIFKNLKEDEILSQLLAEQPIVAADKKERKMLCLPERYIYGWLFSIRSESKELKKYKQECYDVLYNHFHGRFSKLIEKIRIESEMQEIEERLSTNEDFLKYQELGQQKRKIPASLKRMDTDLLKGQVRLDFDNTQS